MKRISADTALTHSIVQALLYWQALFIAALLLSGCAAAIDAWPGSFTYATLPASGDSAAGKVLFQAGTLRATACGACHALGAAPAEAGPNLTGIARRAATGWSGHSAEDYLFRAIVYPTAHIVSGYSGGLMPVNYGTTLDQQQLRNLIAYLLTL